MNVLRVTTGLAEITEVYEGSAELHGGVLEVRGRLTGDLDVYGGRAFVQGTVEGSVNNLGGTVRITGTVLGTITGAPAYTIIDVTDQVTGAFEDWDPVATAAQSRKTVRPPSAASQRAALLAQASAGRATAYSVLIAAITAAATLLAIALLDDNTNVLPAEAGAAAEVLIVEKVDD